MEYGGALNANLHLTTTPRSAISCSSGMFSLHFSVLFQMGAGGGSDILPAPRSKAQAHGAG